MAPFIPFGKLYFALGLVRARCVIGVPGGETREVEMLADSGAFYPIIPPSLASELGIEAKYSTRLTLADRRVVEAKVGLAYFKLLDREGIFQVAILDVPEPLLGVTVFEGLGVRIDPATGRLEYSRPYGLAAI